VRLTDLARGATAGAAAGLALAALGGCGNERVVTQTVERMVTAPAEPAGTDKAPALLKAPRRPGEILLTGNTSPKSFGPQEFETGIYTFRFEQYAPDLPGLDYATDASSITVSLDRKPRVPAADSVVLINSAQKKGESPIYVTGKYYVDVTSADQSYALRFTPRP
jgi:hypothetical protein